MILPVVKFGDPVLRKKGSRIETITPDVSQLIQDMLETMYDSNGVGLAAQQVGQALQLTVIDVREAERPSWLEIDGKPAPVEAIMPLVLINPELKPGSVFEEGSEGCLSFPEMYAEIKRPESVDVTALNAKGEKISFRCGGLLARAIQHETDHLNGILFIDRMDSETKSDLKPEYEALQIATKKALAEKIRKI
jgi:peptide deformylase